MADDANTEQREYWNEQAGPTWVRNQERLDAQIQPWGELALNALAAAPGEAVLDVGCGCGATSLALAAQVGPEGRVVGLDLSGPMLARARERAAAEGRANVSFLQADAQTHAFAPEFDALFSRFGVMFFDDPPAAFANLAGALRPGGRLSFACWQGREQNGWVSIPMAALIGEVELPPPPAPDAPGPFALGDPDRLRALLEGAGPEGRHAHRSRP